MRFVIQRVKSASLSVDNTLISKIDKGLLVFVGVCKDDEQKIVKKCAEKLASLRVFEEDNKMNKNIMDKGYEILLVSNFTLCTKETSGARPDFGLAKDRFEANHLYNCLANELTLFGVKVKLGKFGEDMQINADLDGPVTIYKEIL